MITLKNIEYSIYEGNKTRKILNIPDALFKDNEINVISGPSGSGKTSLLYVLAGLLDIKSGNVFIDSNDLYSLSKDEKDRFRLNNIGIIYQNYNLFNFMNVTDNIVIPMLLNNIPITNEIYKAVNNYLLKMNLGNIGNKSINTLSGGEQQRIAIIRSLICKPKIILCDEPTSSLDSTNTKIFMDTLQVLKKEYNNTIIIASHDKQVMSYADNLITLKDGEII